MTLWSCPHCGNVIELLGEPREPICDCGGLLEPVEAVEIPTNPEAA